MDKLFNIALAIHIFFGGVALVIAPLATMIGMVGMRIWRAYCVRKFNPKEPMA